jgi:hypothetical protein
VRVVAVVTVLFCLGVGIGEAFGGRWWLTTVLGIPVWGVLLYGFLAIGLGAVDNGVTTLQANEGKKGKD